MSKVRKNGVIIIPSNVRRLLHIDTGDEYYVEADRKNDVPDNHNGWIMVKIYWDPKYT